MARSEGTVFKELEKNMTHCHGMSQPGKQSEEWRKAPVLHATPLVLLQIVISQDMKSDLYWIGFLQTLFFSCQYCRRNGCKF